MQPRRSRLPDLGPRGEGWVLGQLALLGLAFVVPLPGISLLAPDGLASWLAVVAGASALLLAGVVFALAVRGLGPSLTPLPRPRDEAELVQSGIYRRIRHPIYASLILAALGWSTLTSSVPAVGAAALLALFLDAKARREEGWLLDRYPNYAAYQRRTKRFLPGIY